eukprot:2566108-Amphidinium_carterae.1
MPGLMVASRFRPIHMQWLVNESHEAPLSAIQDKVFKLVLPMSQYQSFMSSAIAHKVHMMRL